MPIFTNNFFDNKYEPSKSNVIFAGNVLNNVSYSVLKRIDTQHLKA